MSNTTIRCGDEEAYKYVAELTPFSGSVFSSHWRDCDHSLDRRFIVRAWGIPGIRSKYRQPTNVFSPILIWEGHMGHGLWYGVSGDNAWICNALTSNLIMDGETIYPLTPKEMLVMQDYGIGGVSAMMRGTGINKKEQM